MSDTLLLPAPRPSADVQARLLDRAEERMLAPARLRGYELRLVGATVLPQRKVIARTEHGTWMFVDHVEDPTADAYRGKIPIPAEQHARLADLHDAGVRPDLLWLGHQLPEGWREGDAVPVPAPPHVRRKDERLIQRLGLATTLFVRGAVASVAFAAAAPLAAAGAIASAGAGLDPIVLGGIRDPEAPVVQWALLAQWEWE